MVSLTDQRDELWAEHSHRAAHFVALCAIEANFWLNHATRESSFAQQAVLAIASQARL